MKGRHEDYAQIAWPLLIGTLAGLLISAAIMFYVIYRIVSFTFWVLMLA